MSPRDARSLAERTARYVAIRSVSREERELADEVERTLLGCPDLTVRRVGDNVVARTEGRGGRRVLVAGHLDTVPGEAGVAVREGAVHGLGACDMKGSIAIMVDLATAGRTFAGDVTWVFYAREEIAREHSGLLELAAADPRLLEADAAILCEPTAGRVEAGCQGTVTVELVLRGARAHTARPWRGRNAIHRLAAAIARVAAYEPREVLLDGVRFCEQRQAVVVAGGVANNVVPDVASLRVNHRLAPDRTTDEAVAQLRADLQPFLEDGDRLDVLDVAPGAPPGLDDPLLARLVALSGVPPAAKLGYTDVSFFAERGIPAANFGAGDPELAHQAGEFVAIDELERCASLLAAALQGG